MKEEFLDELNRSGRNYAGTTKKIYRRSIGDVEKITEKSIDEVTPDEVRKWVVSLEGRYRAPNTRRTLIAAIRRYFRRRPEMLKELPLPKSPPRRAVLSRSEVQKFLKEPKDNLIDEAITSIVYSDLTLREILSVSAEMIDEKGYARIEILPEHVVTKQLRWTTVKILRKHIKTLEGKNPKLFQRSERWIQKTIRKYHPYATASLLRRSFISHAYEIGKKKLCEKNNEK